MTENPVATNPAPKAPNPLVATDGAKKESPLEGAGLIQDFGDALIKFSSGDWGEGLANLVIGGVSFASDMSDPLGALAKAGIGWVIEHVSFLREPLDWLTGDQVALENLGGTWGNIGDELSKVADELRQDVARDSATWTGTAADAYRAFANDRADLYESVATGAQGISVMIAMCKSILAVVRSLVRDLISECVWKLIWIVCRYPGPAMPAGLAAEGVPMAIRWATKIMDKVKQLTKAFGNASGLIKKLGAMFGEAKRLLQGVNVKDVAKNFGNDVSGLAKTLGDDIANLAAYGKVGAKDIADDFGKEVSDAVKKVPDAVTKEVLKEAGKKAGEIGDKLVSGGDDKKDGKDGAVGAQSAGSTVQPVFDQPGGQRISGSI
ncbi:MULTISPECIES: WXG100 family type VII secretion target [Amycolatopsis]|uniref:WXG100 family type VII secretion target n=1 Tax=Amycolatopsis TaxID=1813 RepID=UPI000F78945B|nr:hypothetical protein [Amycolatopsis sp. WAC 04197]RSN49104.1 hypothetical protein DMC64_00460 [Amycolatopsis sp. WAC 04197]